MYFFGGVIDASMSYECMGSTKMPKRANTKLFFGGCYKNAHKNKHKFIFLGGASMTYDRYLWEVWLNAHKSKHKCGKHLYTEMDNIFQGPRPRKRTRTRLQIRI